MRFWHIARWVLLVVWALAVTLVFVRGPEDTWIRDASGAWVAHGHPAGPAPAPGYQPPLLERAMPGVFLGLFGLALLAGIFLAGRSPASREAINKSIRYYGAMSMMASILAIGVVLALVLGTGSQLGEAFRDPGVVVIVLVAAAVLLKTLSWHADGTKRLLEAHYDLRRTVDLLQDTLERLPRGPNIPPSSSVDRPSPDTV
jgi:hypothetical protein